MSVDNTLVDLTVAIEIENFLSGKNDGHGLFQRLYGTIADEPIPERLLAVVREKCGAAEAAVVEAPAAPLLRLAAAS
jgi:hypothetical protein